MEVITSKETLEKRISEAQNKGSIGFVPTMGALHKGHLSLVEESRQNNPTTVVSIFVNPTQFDNKEDLKKYPNRFQEDKALLEENGVDFLFYPSVEEIYPEGLKVESIDLAGLDSTMEGTYRKGHFEGVATIVKRLLEWVQPDFAYFGEKDFQQLQIVKNVVKQFNLPVQIIGMPTLREPNGLAMSSRNMRLTEEQKSEAAIIHQTLVEIQQNAPHQSPQELLARVYKNFAFSPLQLIYCIIAEEESLKPALQFEKNHTYRAFIAANCGEIRLIDNIEIL